MQRLAATTRGVWAVGHPHGQPGFWVVWDSEGHWVATTGEGKQAELDAEFIAHSPEAIENLLEVARVARFVIYEWRNYPQSVGRELEKLDAVLAVFDEEEPK